MSGPQVTACMDCREPATWRVSTMGGWVEFCDRHAQWYLDKSPDIYPAERIGWEEIGGPLAETSGPADGPAGAVAGRVAWPLRLVKADPRQEEAG